jgi:threonine aldolase
MGNEIILSLDSHILNYETGAAASLGHVLTKSIPTNKDGAMEIKDIELLIRKDLDDPHFPHTKLICLE